jgi:hypothetical protein
VCVRRAFDCAWASARGGKTRAHTENAEAATDEAVLPTAGVQRPGVCRCTRKVVCYTEDRRAVERRGEKRGERGASASER